METHKFQLQKCQRRLNFLDELKKIVINFHDDCPVFIGRATLAKINASIATIGNLPEGKEKAESEL